MTPPRFCATCGTALVPPDTPDRKPSCPTCGWFRPTDALPVVLVLARSPSGRILYTRKRDWPVGAWGLVAGFVESGETAEGAALREVAEETGLSARRPRVVRTMRDRDLLLVCVTVDIDDATPRPGSDVDEVLLRLPDLSLTPATWPARAFIDDMAWLRTDTYRTM